MTHLENVSEEEMNRLLGIVLDVEYLYTCIHKEEDADTKQVYFSLFKVILLLYTRFEARYSFQISLALNKRHLFPLSAAEEVHPTDG